MALTFLNDPCASTHGRICTYSIFISPSGEWKLGGFELLSNPNDDAAVLYVRVLRDYMQGVLNISSRILVPPFLVPIHGLHQK